jgi:hypothetical protein
MQHIFVVSGEVIPVKRCLRAAACALVEQLMHSHPEVACNDTFLGILGHALDWYHIKLPVATSVSTHTSPL